MHRIIILLSAIIAIGVAADTPVVDPVAAPAPIVASPPAGTTIHGRLLAAPDAGGRAMLAIEAGITLPDGTTARLPCPGSGRIRIADGRAVLDGLWFPRRDGRIAAADAGGTMIMPAVADLTIGAIVVIVLDKPIVVAPVKPAPKPPAEPPAADRDTTAATPTTTTP